MSNALSRIRIHIRLYFCSLNCSQLLWLHRIFCMRAEVSQRSIFPSVLHSKTKWQSYASLGGRLLVLHPTLHWLRYLMLVILHVS